jgi:hypothetical protein
LEMFDNLKETGKLEPKRKPEDFGPGDGPKWARRGVPGWPGWQWSPGLSLTCVTLGPVSRRQNPLRFAAFEKATI